jgi:DNA-binding transcriptional ArsR family regulator
MDSAQRYLDEQALEQAAECLRVLAHPTRLRIVQLLLRGQFTVGELAEACDIRSHSASEHLRLMQHCGLLSARREGRKMFYQVAEPHLESIMNCIEERFYSDRKEICAGDEQ